MKESLRPEYSEFPEEVDLATAITLNKILWRTRDKSFSRIPAIEMPDEVAEPVFEEVTKRYLGYVDEIHIKHLPAVGYSPFPDSVVSWGHADYRPDYGKRKRMALFDEFGTDWLANVVFGKDPLEQNCYLGRVVARIKKIDYFSAEDMLLAGIIASLSSNSISKEEITELFAKVLIGGDATGVRGMTAELPDGTKVDYSDKFFIEEEGEDDRQQIPTMELSSEEAMRILKPIAQALSFGAQVYLSRRNWQGLAVMPGIINVRGAKPSDVDRVTLAHEFIHELGLHENNFNGMPIKGYKLMGGVVLKRNGKT